MSERLNHIAMRPKGRPTGRAESGALIAAIPDLRRLARILAGNPERAEDLLQEALLQVWARLCDGARIDDLGAYLRTTLRNLARRHQGGGPGLDEVPEPAAPEVMAARLALGDVARALAAMPAPERRLVLRRAGEGASYAELARAEALPVGTVMSRLARLRRRLRSECGLPEGGPVVAALIGEDA